MSQVVKSNLNKFQLETIYIKVKNLGKSLNYMTNILGFGFIRTEFSELSVRAFLHSNFSQARKSIQFCIEQEFYGKFKGDIKFGIKPISQSYVESICSLNRAGFNLSHFESSTVEDSISYDNQFTEFKDMELQSFIVENETWEKIRFYHLINLESKNSRKYDDDIFMDEKKFDSFCDSYLKEIQIKVNNLRQYHDMFSRLGFEVLPIEIDKSGVRNMQVVMNERCEINLRLIETAEKLENLSSKDYISFEIASNSGCEEVGSTFKDLIDIGYSFSNLVFDEEENIIADYGELVTPDDINWRISEDLTVGTFF